MANYIVWAGTRETVFENLDEAIKYATKVNKRNKYPARILGKANVENGVANWEEIDY